MNRKNFIRHSAVTGAGLLSVPVFAHSQKLTQHEDPLPAEKVQEFVKAGHGNLDKVKSMLREMPTLLYATWDWGKGDFETALEGAGHVGNKEIANYLIAKGARANLFVLTMLGKTALVKGFLENFPEYHNARGPHGLSFYHHAQKGGEEAQELLEYFAAKGLTQIKLDL